MKTVDEAWALLDSVVRPLAAERVDLGAALGRVLREDIVADADMPAFPRSAMDGFLVTFGEAGRLLRISGEVMPGELARMPLPGSAIRVFTGSAVPDAGVAIVAQEDVVREGDSIRLLSEPDAGHIRPRGSHARRGEALLASGTRMAPGGIALLATVGASAPLVSAEIRAAHIATGGELVGHETLPGEGQVRDSNSPMIAALMAELGVADVWQGRTGEDPEELTAAISDALAAEPRILLISGGASVGDHDRTGTALRDAGFEMLIEGVAVRPGKPLIVARRNDLLAFGLPGNPLSHFVCFHLFVRRAIDLLLGAAPAVPVSLPVGDAELLRPGPRETWWPCRLAWTPSAIPLPWRDSSDIVSLAMVDGLLRVPPAGIGADGVAAVLPIRGVGLMREEGSVGEASGFSHFDASGDVRMVDVGAKPTQMRTAVAAGELRCRPATLRALRDGALPKGDVLATAKIAAIQAAKRTAELVPLCHTLPLDKVSVGFVIQADRIEILAEVICRANTGVEMEALTAVSVAALTLYDMMKAADKDMRIEAVRLVEKKKV